MKTTMKILPLMLGIMLFFTQCEKEVIETNTAGAMMELKSNEDCSVTQILWAGAGQNDITKGTNVGTVTATIVGNKLYVDYDVTNGWYGVEYHLWVGKAIKDIPRNAAPGLFPFSGSASYSINLTERGFEPGDPIYIAAHAVVTQGEGGIEVLEADLPEDVVFEWTPFNNLSVSYFDNIYIGEDSWLAGDYDGWCADPEEIIGGNPRSGTVYSSYDPKFLDVILTPYAFDRPHNLPLINWIINEDFVGEQSQGGVEYEDQKGNTLYTLGDVQRAMWLLLWDDPNMNVIGGVGPYNDNRVQDIIVMAEAEGVSEDGVYFKPGCDEYLVLVIVQGNVPHKQPVFIKILVPCGDGGEETAWAFGGYTFIGEKIARKWGWIFEMTYSVCEEAEEE